MAGTIKDLLGDIATNPAKATQLKQDPEGTLANYDVSGDERAALMSGDPEKIHSLVTSVMQPEGDTNIVVVVVIL